ncbi:transcription factor IIIC, subunit 5, partial [Dimargaris cristalligena]
MASNSAPPPPAYEAAPEGVVPMRDFFMVEYPGHVRDVTKVLRTLGGPLAIDQAYQSKNGALELRYRYEDPFSHSIRGQISRTGNILIKVTRRIRRRKQVARTNPLPPPLSGDSLTDDEEDVQILKMSTEVCGFISQTGRFRGLADYQISSSLNDPLAQFKRASETLDRPVISQVMQPMNYQYRQSASAVKSYIPKYIDQPEEPVLFNRRVNAIRTFTVGHYEDMTLPQQPASALLQRAQQTCPPVVLEHLSRYFREQPIWPRSELLHRLGSELQAEGHLDRLRDVTNDPKILLGPFAYVMRAGPWNLRWIRYGFDPRREPSARWAQQVAFRSSHIRKLSGAPTLNASQYLDFPFLSGPVHMSRFLLTIEFI